MESVFNVHTRCPVSSSICIPVLYTPHVREVTPHFYAEDVSNRTVTMNMYFYRSYLLKKKTQTLHPSLKMLNPGGKWSG